MRRPSGLPDGGYASLGSSQNESSGIDEAESLGISREASLEKRAQDDYWRRQGLLGRGMDELARLSARVPRLVDLLLVAALYMAVGPALIVLNKTIMTEMHFPYPFFLAAMGQGSCWLTTLVLFRITGVLKLSMLEHVTWSLYLRKLCVVGGCAAGAIGFGQTAYLHLSVTFIQMLKAATPVITSILLVTLRIERLSSTTWVSVIMMMTGTAIASYGEGHATVLGVATMLMASLCEAVRMVFTQEVLVNLKFPAWEGVYWNAPICTCWMLGASLLREIPNMARAEQAARSPQTAPSGVEPPSAVILRCWDSFLLCCVLSVLVTLSGMLMVRRAGSIALKLMATARNASTRG